jgi:hypothetical protein
MTEDIDALVAQIKSLADVVGELRDELRQGRRRPRRRKADMPASSEIDRRYHLANGTAAAAYRARLVRGRVDPGPGRAGVVVRISPTDAEAAWGPKLAARVG